MTSAPTTQSTFAATPATTEGGRGSPDGARRQAALVTGAAGGVGHALARRLAGMGHALYLTDRSDQVHQVAEELASLGATVWASTADLADEPSVRRLASEAQQRSGGCAILANCAGMTLKVDGRPIPLTDLSVEAWERVQRVNLIAPVLLCRELVPAMAEAGYGRVVNVASRAGRMHVPPAGLEYHASKAGLIGVTRALAGVYAAQGVTINSVAPGRIDTPMTLATSPEHLAQARAAIPMGRFATAEEIAASIVFLLSPEAAYITGCCLDIAGGVFMN